MRLPELAVLLVRAWNPSLEPMLQDLVPPLQAAPTKAVLGFDPAACVAAARELLGRSSSTGKDADAGAVASILRNRLYQKPATLRGEMTAATLVALWLLRKGLGTDADSPIPEGGREPKLQLAVAAILAMDRRDPDDHLLMADPYQNQQVRTAPREFAEWRASHYWEVVDPLAVDPVHALMFAVVTRPGLRQGVTRKPVAGLLDQLHAFSQKDAAADKSGWMAALHRHCQRVCLAKQRPQLSVYLDKPTEQTWLLSPTGRRVLEGSGASGRYVQGMAQERNVGPGHAVWTPLCLAVARGQRRWVDVFLGEESWETAAQLLPAFRVALQYEDVGTLDKLLKVQDGRFRLALLGAGKLPFTEGPKPWSYLTLLASKGLSSRVQAYLDGADMPTALTTTTVQDSRRVSERAFCERHYPAVAPLLQGALVHIDEPASEDPAPAMPYPPVDPFEPRPAMVPS